MSRENLARYRVYDDEDNLLTNGVPYVQIYCIVTEISTLTSLLLR